MLNVCHFLRKSTQLRASFINNQISHHVRYSPYLIFRLHREKKYDGGYAVFEKDIEKFDLSRNQTTIEKILYTGPKTLSQNQLKDIKAFLTKNDIQILHFHYGTDCGIFYPLLQRLKIPTVVSFYGYDVSSFPKYLNGYGRHYLKNRVFKDITKVLAMSPDMKLDLINAGCPEEKIIIHYYGTDCQKFNNIHIYAEKQNVTILTLSNLCHKKGHIFQFQAIKKLIEMGITNFEMRVAGSGELEMELKKYVNQNNLNKYIHFLGPLKYGSQEMLNEYKNANIFLHPSVIAPNGDKEGIPGTIIEAMSSGLPVISTYHAGIPYIIENDKTGLLVEEWDTEELTGALIQLIENRELRERIGVAAQQYALNHLDLKNKENELEAIYDSLIQ